MDLEIQFQYNTVVPSSKFLLTYVYLHVAAHVLAHLPHLLLSSETFHVLSHVSPDILKLSTK